MQPKPLPHLKLAPMGSTLGVGLPMLRLAIQQSSTSHNSQLKRGSSEQGME